MYVGDGTAGDCGSLTFLCASGFTFPRTDTLPHRQPLTRPATSTSGTNRFSPSHGDSYQPDGQSQVHVAKFEGSTWTFQTPDAQTVGDQFWPNLAFDSSNGKLVLIYYDSRRTPATR